MQGAGGWAVQPGLPVNEVSLVAPLADSRPGLLGHSRPGTWQEPGKTRGRGRPNAQVILRGLASRQTAIVVSQGTGGSTLPICLIGDLYVVT